MQVEEFIRGEEISKLIWVILKAAGWKDEWYHDVSHVNLSQYDEKRAEIQRKLIDEAALELLNDLVGTPEKIMQTVQLKTLIKPVVATQAKFILGHDDIRVYIPTEFRYKVEIKEKSLSEEEEWQGTHGTMRLYNESFPDIYPITSNTAANMNTELPIGISPNITAMKIVSIVLNFDADSVSALLEKVNHLAVGFKDFNTCNGRFVQRAKFIVLSEDTEFRKLIESQGISFVSPDELIENE
jgi:hypothetical protein